jgi:hypothetical protein
MATIHVSLGGMMIFKRQNYAGKLYNFVLFDMVCKLEMRLLVWSRTLFKEHLPFHILKIWIAHQ